MTFDENNIINKLKTVEINGDFVTVFPQERYELFKDKNKKVSICVPVFNAEKSIQRCLDSILEQNFQDCEILVVDNLSTDKTYSIACKYALKNKMILVIQNSKNIGRIENWNRCLDVASGQYIKFVMVNDYLLQNNISSLCKVLDENKNVVLTRSAFSMLNSQKEFHFCPLFENSKMFTGDEAIEYCLREGNISAGPTAQMFRRSTIIENDLKFDEKLSWASDFDFAMKGLEHGDFFYLQEPLYVFDASEQRFFKTAALLSRFDDECSVRINLLKRNSEYQKHIPAILEKFYSLLKEYIYQMNGLEAKNLLLSCMKWILKLEVLSEQKHFSSYLSTNFSDERSEISYMYLVEFLIKEGRYEDAKSILSEFLKLNQEDTDALINLSVVYYYLGDNSKAISTLQNVLSIDPYNEIAIENLMAMGVNYDDKFLGIMKNITDGSNITNERRSFMDSKISNSKDIPLVSIIIPCYNQAIYLSEAVESIAQQTFSNWECIIVNDGSTDNTSEVARQLTVKYSDKQLRLVEKENSGLSDARNAGIKSSHGKYILPLDADDKIHPEKLKKSVSLLETHPEIAIAYTDVVHFGKTYKVIQEKEYDFKLLCFQNHLNYCSLYRREVWEAAGGYNSNMTLGYEDWDFWISCGEKGYYGKRIPEPLFMYRVKEDSMYTKALKYHKELVNQIILNHPKLYNNKYVYKTKNLINQYSDDKFHINTLDKSCPSETKYQFLPSGKKEQNKEDYNNRKILVDSNISSYKQDNIKSKPSVQKQFNILPNVEMAIYFPKQIHFLMNDKCNAKCIMCGGDYYNSTSGKATTLEKFKIMAVNLKLEYTQGIVLAGAGDPLLNKDLISIIPFVKKEYPHIKVSITTNGIALSNNVSRQLLENNIASINISINSATRMTYKRIMQVDCFDKICKNTKTLVQMRNLMGKNIQIQFSCAINKLNIEELPLLVELGENIGIDSINIMYCRFYPERIRHVNVDKEENRLNNSDSLFYYQELSDCMVEQAKTIAQKNNIRFSHEPLFKENALPRPCAWPYTETMVGFDGEIYPCGGAEVHFKEKVEQGIYNFGNALTNPIDSFWNNDHYRALRIASKQGETCLIPECRYCANIVVPNDIKFHIMQWDNDNDKRETLPEEKLNVPTISTSNTELPLVSVIVPTYNRPEMLVETLKSILNQTYQKFEIIVVNDAGVDVESVVSPLNKNKSITCVKHDRNKGLAAARNTGIKVATGKYLAYLDDDDIFYPDHLETLVEFLENENYKVAYTDAYRAYQELENGKYLNKKRDIPYSFDFDYTRILAGNFIPVLCVMHEKSCVGDAGMFDESLGAHEDWDLWIRMSRKYQFAHIKKITCEFTWRQDGTTMTLTKKDIMDSTRNIVLQRGLSYKNTENNVSDKAHSKTLAQLFDAAEKLFQSGVYNEAIEIYKKIIVVSASSNKQLSSENNLSLFDAYYNLALSYLNINHIDEAISAFKKVIELNNKDSSLYNNLGVLYSKKNMYNEAIAYFEKALGLDVNYIEARQNLDKVSKILESNSNIAQIYPKNVIVSDTASNNVSTSIIIPVFNKIEYTKKCLETLYENTQGNSFEVVVVDNASIDNTQDYLLQTSHQYKNLSILRNSKNLGFAKACNQGARIAKGKYLVFLNNDTEPQVGWLDAGVERLKSDKQIGIAGSKLLYPDETIQHCGIELMRHQDAIKYTRGLSFIWPQHRYQYADRNDPRVNIPEEVHAVTGACLFISRELFIEVGGFTEDYGMYFEDTDLCFKVRKLGKKVFYEPGSVVIHHEGKSSPNRQVIDDLNSRASSIFYPRWLKEIQEIQLKHFCYP